MPDQKWKVYPMLEFERKRKEAEDLHRLLNKIVIVIIALSALSGILAAVCTICKDARKKEEQKKVDEQKELYRKLAAVKGRQ